MLKQGSVEALRGRVAPMEMSPDDFREVGHQLIDHIADFLGSLPARRLGPGKTPAQIRTVLGGAPLPENGTPADKLLEEATNLMFDHSMFNGHPRFWGYITSSAAPIGALGDLLASTVNANVGGWALVAYTVRN